MNGPASVVDTTVASERLLAALRECEALLEGHFLLSSGRHAGRYVQCARLLQHPRHAEAACQDLAAILRRELGPEQPIDVVVGPAMGAVTLAYELARALGVRGLFAERAPEGGFQMRRGFAIRPGERVLVVEDVVTTGKSAKEVLRMLDAEGHAPVAVASLVNRSGVENPFDRTYARLIDLEVPSWDADDCLLCRESGQPAVKPGSRPNPS